MTSPSSLSKAELEHARDLGAATYLSAYVHLMARALDVDDSDNDSVNAMIIPMIEPLNHALEAVWRSMVNDKPGMVDAMERFRKAVEGL